VGCSESQQSLSGDIIPSFAKLSDFRCVTKASRNEQRIFYAFRSPPSGRTFINPTRSRLYSYLKVYCPHGIDLTTIIVSGIFMCKCDIVPIYTLASAL